MNLDNLLELGLYACDEACKAILNAKTSLQIWEKKDKSPLSSADLAADEVIYDILSKSDIKICSEERVLDFEQRKDLEYFWLVDPLDGTQDFIKGSDEYCILIALIHKQRPILALIKEPKTGDCFYAHRYSKVYKNNQILIKDDLQFENNKNLALFSTKDLEANAFVKANGLERFKINSGLKFKILLEGRAGIYIRFESLHSWDIAAGDFLLNQNGGLMRGLDGQFLSYNQPSFLCNAFLATSLKEYLNEFTF